MAFCEPFWKAVEPAWAEQVGQHIEGEVKEVLASRGHGGDLVSLRLAHRAGSVPAATEVVLGPIPRTWLQEDEETGLRSGDLIRILYVRGEADGDEPPATLKTDKPATVAWIVPAEHRSEEASGTRASA
jgi:hypothetical protein